MSVHGIVVKPHWNNVLHAKCACGWQAWEPTTGLSIKMEKHLRDALPRMITYIGIASTERR